MIFEKLPLEGAYLVKPERHEDMRGYFARGFCAQEFGSHGLESLMVQANLSHNKVEGLVRGMHYQDSEFAEAKLIRCVAGSIYDVVIDMRPYSKTYLNWFGSTLSAENGCAMYVPKGFAHGYQSLTRGSLAFYLVSQYHEPSAERGIHYMDPEIGIEWPLPVTVVSAKDAAWPLIRRNS